MDYVGDDGFGKWVVPATDSERLLRTITDRNVFVIDPNLNNYTHTGTLLGDNVFVGEDFTPTQTDRQPEREAGREGSSINYHNYIDQSLVVRLTLCQPSRQPGHVQGSHERGEICILTENGGGINSQTLLDSCFHSLGNSCNRGPPSGWVSLCIYFG